MFCNHCGKEVESGTTFCGECGAPVGTQNQTGDGTRSLELTPDGTCCKNCNAPLEKGAVFCGECGCAAEQTQDTDISGLSEGYPEPPQMLQQSPQANQKKKENLTPLVIILISVVIISGVAIWFMLANPFGNKDLPVVENYTSTPSATPTVTATVTPPAATPSGTPSAPPAVTPVPAGGGYNLEMAKTALDGYMHNLTAAINAGSYRIVEPYILSGSSLYEQQTELVPNLYSKNITEKLLDYKILDTQWVNDTKCYFFVEEKFEITYPSKTEVNSYQWKYTVQYYNGKFYLSDIEDY